jgi:hypothetical protein
MFGRRCYASSRKEPSECMRHTLKIPGNLVMRLWQAMMTWMGKSVGYNVAGTGAGELARASIAVGTGVVPSPLSPLFSLTALLSSLTLVSLEPAESLLTSSEKAAERLGAFHEGTSHTTPVKLRRVKPFFSHLRHLNFPVRSRARRPALMAPWFALGPSFEAGVAAAKGLFVLGSLIMSPL